MRRLTLLAVMSLGVLMTVGVATASAHRGGPGKGSGVRGVAVGSLVTEAGKQLDVSRAKLKAAIVDSAVAEIDEAVEDEDIDAGEAAERKEEASENLRFAYRLSRTRTVASNLGITTARLNSGFRAARQTLILRRIDEAVEDGDLDEEEAAELKAELAEAKLPGYKPAGRGFGIGFGDGPAHHRGGRG